MSTPTLGADAAGSKGHSVTLAWALKRTLMGMVIFAVVIGGAAWLLHTSIDPSLDADASSLIAKPANAAQASAKY